MSHNSKPPEGARPFLDKASLKELAKTWKAGAQKFEPTHIGGSNYPVNYFADRIEGNHREDETIEHIHGESFIEKVIPNKLKDLKPGQKLKILDNGAGAALFVDQIRAAFDDKVDVYSTGISKRVAQTYRRDHLLPKLKLKDLKWRSISQLKDFPEFDLIIDTWGEQYYRTIGNRKGENLLVDASEYEKHLEQVVKKLLPGGYASLSPILLPSIVKNCLKGLEKRYSFQWGFLGGALKIWKGRNKV